MLFSYFNSENIKCYFAPVIGDKWSDLKPKMKNDTIASIFSAVDNGDDIIQKEEISLLKKLFTIADDMIREKSQDKVITDEEAQKLLEQIKNNTINIESLRKEAKHEITEEQFSNATDITKDLNIQTVDGYRVQVLRTNAQVQNKVSGNDKEINYNTYLIKFQNQETSEIQEIKIHFAETFNEQAIAKMIKQLVEESYDNVMDVICNELNDLYINPTGDSRKVDKTKNTHYKEVKGRLKPDGYYSPKDESIVLFIGSGHNIDLGVLIHELGHAKDNKVLNKGRINQKLFDLISKIEPKKSAQNYFLATVDEMYAELFKSYAHLRNHVSEKLNKDYRDILEKLPPDARKKFLQEVTISCITEENMTVEAILSRAGLAEYKDVLNDFINTNIKIKNLNYLEAITQFTKIKKYAKKNPQILVEFHNTMRGIASDYNNPKNARKHELV